ncbi:MAG: hypothetical protein LBV26_05590 [Bacteroidales bacterium]|jgi:hypothetical protein|nr:hypothetical protein [Bacteroidales bacterium]
MSKKTYAEKINDAEVMSAGLTRNAEQAAKRGLDKAFIDRLSASLQRAKTLNNEQEQLKYYLKQKTEALETTMVALHADVAEARKIVKIDFPKVQWVEFGIKDKK